MNTLHILILVLIVAVSFVASIIPAPGNSDVKATSRMAFVASFFILLWVLFVQGKLS